MQRIIKQIMVISDNQAYYYRQRLSWNGCDRGTQQNYYMIILIYGLFKQDIHVYNIWCYQHVSWKHYR